VIARGARYATAAVLVALAALISCAKGRRPPVQPAEAAPPPAPAAPPVLIDAAALGGDWARAAVAAAEGIQGFRLGDDGRLTIVGTAPTRGVGWKSSGASLVLSLENAGVGPWEVTVPVEAASPSRLELGGGNKAFAGEWRRATFTTVEGTVTYRQRSALTPQAVVFVDLRDAGAPPEDPPVSRARVTSPGQAPVSFALTYDPASLDPSRSYVLSARITDRGELRFVTTSPVPLPTAGDAPPVEIVVGPVR